jgi:uncharacterized RDD family membrane protein YckC
MLGANASPLRALGRAWKAEALETPAGVESSLPPKRRVDQELGGDDRPDGVLARRSAAWVIDGVVLTIPYMLIHAALGGLGVLIGTAGAFVYWTLLEGLGGGQTVGKRAASVDVHRASVQTQNLGVPRAFLRNIVKCIPITYLWAFARHDDRCLHDLAAGSRVSRS